MLALPLHHLKGNVVSDKEHISILPTLLTIGNFVCGLVCILLCIQSLYWHGASVIVGPFKQLALYQNACLMIFIGMIFDMLDGRVARMTCSSSKFGGELDSLADMCTFGIAPSVVLATLWINAMPETAEWWSFSLIAGVIFSSCAMLRLAIYNLSISETAKGAFKGLPSPAAAGAVVSVALFFSQNYINKWWINFYNFRLRDIIGDIGYSDRNTPQIVAIYILSFFFIIVGLLMVSHFKFTHVANIWLGKTRKVGIFLAILAAISLLSIEKTRNTALFFGFNGYILTCLVINLRNCFLKKEHATDQDIIQLLSLSDIDEEKSETESSCEQ